MAAWEVTTQSGRGSGPRQSGSTLEPGGPALGGVVGLVVRLEVEDERRVDPVEGSGSRVRPAPGAGRGCQRSTAGLARSRETSLVVLHEVRGKRSADRPRTVVDMSRLLSVHGHTRRGARAAPMMGEPPGRRNRINEPGGPGSRTCSSPRVSGRETARGRGDRELVDPGPVVVDVHHRAARPVEQAGGDAGAVAGAAVHPQLARRAASPGRRSTSCTGGVRRRAGGRPRTRRAAGRPRRPGPGRRRGSRSSPRAGTSPAAVGAGSSTCVPTPSMPMPARSRRAGARSASRSVRTTSWPYHGTSHPTYVANWGEYSTLTVPARCASANRPRPRRSTTQAPSAIASLHLVRRERLGRERRPAPGAGPVERRPCARSRRGPGRSRRPARRRTASWSIRSAGLTARCCPIGRRRRRRGSTGAARAEAAEAVRGVQPGLGVERAERAGAGPLGAGEVAREQVAEQVGPPDRALQEAAAAEQRARVAVGGVAGAGQERLVVPGVARGGDHPDVEPADADHVAVAHARPARSPRTRRPRAGSRRRAGAPGRGRPTRSRCARGCRRRPRCRPAPRPPPARRPRGRAAGRPRAPGCRRGRGGTGCPARAGRW